MSGRGTRSTGGAANKTTPPDASRIQSSQAKAGKDVGKGTFPARVQSAATKNTTTAPSAPAPKASKGSQK
ncbi:hypothetical protein BDY19DRAFT_996215 [Irpex rosettiformis]|uniref:Uncharacterized protein n=1 Tax=Irpex rosettiformis TaxID=378272 RepID=A0ACB8TVR5_9APHY|nr:hypothetical protein BDY19DRAFT_996215 [Irpex rosettiformis]